ncbi:carboxypeptidase-like regulatory domain-containing protein [Maribacter halichondriae]|uniref:carboxypeptidase-like regulatory domain-containing protein n=1 Tax=Maribacter halichondriae TaxID=2980554 RepID=UPI0023593205|nr:carboxypeptidase-like regulatory domain-containing protein [Maribacter sp. Hal144]
MKISFATTYFLLLFLVCTSSLKSQEKAKTVFGTVTDGQTPLSDVSVFIKGTVHGTTTDEEGKYSIKVLPKTTLIFSHVGKESLEIVIEDITRQLNVELRPDFEQLDEVVVTKRKRKTQKDFARNYYNDTSIINTDFGYLSPELVGYELRVVDGKNLNSKARDILDAIAEQLPGMIVRTKWGERFLFTSSFGSLRDALPVAYELDGHVWKEAPVELDIRKVIRIGVIPAGKAIRRYGPVASGGMVVINTSDVNHGSDEDGNRPFDLARLRGNKYTYDALDNDNILKNETRYIKNLHASRNVKEALEVYENHKTTYGDSYSFAIDTYRFLKERFDDNTLANRVIDNHAESFKENPVALKALAYVHQDNGDFEQANQVYRELFLLRPNYVQSYMDLANSYRDIGEYKKAASLYSRYDHLVEKGLLANDTLTVTKMMDREFNNLITLKGKNIFPQNDLHDFKVENDFDGTRLVFEWNDGEAEFELQFVNPEGHYYATEHSLFADPERIREEKLAGYSCEEFLIDESLQGTWQVNAKYLGNKRLTPSYLKATIYYDYGSAAQRKETNVFKLGLKNVNQELFKIQNTASITSN